MTSNWSTSSVATWVWEIPYDRASAPGFNSGVSSTMAAVYRIRWRRQGKEQIMNWYLEVLKKYAVFNGRARRKEYWMFFLFNIIISIVLIIVDGIVGTSAAPGALGLLGGLYALALLIPGIAVAVRRLHDTGRSGWWILIGLVPFVGGIILIVFLVQDGTPGDNQFGSNPKMVTA
jgi:uncharacterized membrane protein YhaH (DUF805 family)